MSPESDEQIGTKTFTLFLVTREECCIETAQGTGILRHVAQYLGQPYHVVRRNMACHSGSFSGRHLSGHNQTFSVTGKFCMQTSRKRRLVRRIPPFDAPHFGQGFLRETEKRFSQRYIDMHRSACMMYCLQQGFINQPVAIPFVLLGMHFGQRHGLFHQSAEHTRLRQRLSVHLTNPRFRTVG